MTNRFRIRLRSRRDVLRLGGALLAGRLGGVDARALASARRGADPRAGASLEPPPPWLEPPEASVEVLPAFVVDVSGNRKHDKADLKIVDRAVGGQRGRALAPRPDYDFRADLYGRGVIDRLDVRTVQKTQEFLRQNPAAMDPRPVTIAWHYGWFNFENRRPKRHHVWYLGGAYSSRNPGTEEQFNDLKNEFGITVDALSWADPDADGNLNRNLELGYLRAQNGRTRHAALLYESLISLRAKPGQRIDFERAKVRKLLVGSFRGMADTLVKLRDDSRARVFTIDRRPVIFLYASHTWGANVDGTGPQYDRIDQALENAMTAFRRRYGARPFLVGEEMTLGTLDSFDEGRRRRGANFDAAFVYHHASSGQFIVDGGRRLAGPYIEQLETVLERTYEGVADHRNRFTNAPLLVIPSLAAGFSRRGVPTLWASRVEYADFLKRMISFHRERYMVPQMQRDDGTLPPALFSIGSWNEEWEGHAVMPFEFNRTVKKRRQHGFDYVMAIKQACGWNHYSGRPLGVLHE